MTDIPPDDFERFLANQIADKRNEIAELEAQVEAIESTLATYRLFRSQGRTEPWPQPRQEG